LDKTLKAVKIGVLVDDWPNTAQIWDERIEDFTWESNLFLFGEQVKECRDRGTSTRRI